MPLRIELAPHERLIIGGAAIRNGPRRSDFVVETQAKVLRERDIITETDADTPAKRLYLALEVAYLSDDPVAAEANFMSLASRIIRADPKAAPLIADIFNCLLGGEYYRALKSGKKLIAFEAETSEQDASPAPVAEAG